MLVEAPATLTYSQRHYAANREKVKAASRAYYQRNRDRILIRDRGYSARNAEARSAYQRQHRVEHKSRLAVEARERRERNPIQAMLKHAKYSARVKNVPFDLTVFDVVLPEFCPVLGMKLFVGRGSRTAASPSLDRFVPSLGYVPGNVRVISWRANDLKADATIDELRAVVQYMETS